MPTVYGDITPRTAGHVVRKFLERVEPTIVLGRVFDGKPLPKGETKTVKMRRSVPLAALDTPLTEGVTPSSQGYSVQDVNATVDQWGGFQELTDVIDDTHEDPVLGEMTDLLADQAGATMEKVRYGIAKAGTQVVYANGTARNAVNTPISRTKVRAAVRLLNRNKASKITRIMASSTEYGTKSVEAAYLCFAHTDAESDIRDMTGFISVADYGSRTAICPEEIGTVENVRFILSPDLAPFPDAGGAKGTMVSTTGTSADVYPFIIVGQHALGDVPFKGRNAMTPMVLNPNTPRGGDPLGQRGTVAWKGYYTAVRLNEQWMVRAEAAVTNL